MDTKKERVVVVGLVECKNNADKTMFVARVRPLGLTAYGTNLEEAKLKLKKMFSDYVALHRKHGTLVQRLNESKLTWCYESKYNGDQPAEFVNSDGSIQLVGGKNEPTETWQRMEELVVVR